MYSKESVQKMVKENFAYKRMKADIKKYKSYLETSKKEAVCIKTLINNLEIILDNDRKVNAD
jgi:hypothetical protein